MNEQESSRQTTPLTDSRFIEFILLCYRNGWFMMGDDGSDDQIYWDNPDPRGIMPLDGMKLSRRLRRRIRSDRFQATMNRDFAAIIDACADRKSTWINTPVRTAYLALHRYGHAHSFEVWHGDELAGGLYGVALGAVFFGESMFTRQTDASKVALAYLMNHLRSTGFELLDIQYPNPHLARLGASSISRTTYLATISSLVDRSDIDILSRNLPTSGSSLLKSYCHSDVD